VSPAPAVRVEAVLAAVRSLCARAGMASPDDDGPRVLEARANVVVALPGGSLVARCPSRTDLLPGQLSGNPWRLVNELALASWLAARGAPVVPPAGPGDALPAGPHHVDGLTLTIWRRAGPVPPPIATPECFGQVLAELHAVAAGYPDAARLAPLGPAVADLAPVVGVLEREGVLPAALLDRLREACRDVAAELLDGADRSGWLALHGDAHPRNLLALDGRMVWNDLEDCCFGPVEWDLATMLSMLALTDPAGAAGSAALRAYGRDAADPALLPYLRGRTLERAVWTAVRASEQPATAQGVGARAEAVAAVHALLDALPA
jgi:Ser/Thr protein kinase RdoA (MazF antagonist)